MTRKKKNPITRMMAISTKNETMRDMMTPRSTFDVVRGTF